MKIFAIRDITDTDCKDLAYLLYYEISKQFYIELPSNADPWQAPFLLSSFAQKGEHTINSYWSKIWVQQRIVPSDRQNIGQIIRDNGINKYDEYDLLMLSAGRCEQDDYYLVPISETDFPAEIIARSKKRVDDVIPLQNNCLLVFFRDNIVKKCNLTEFFNKTPRFAILAKQLEIFRNVKIQPGGYGVQWDENLSISNDLLYKIGKCVPLSADDFKSIASERIINTSEAAEILNCSRQYINELVKAEKLHPIKISDKNTLFMKSEILQRNWQ